MNEIVSFLARSAFVVVIQIRIHQWLLENSSFFQASFVKPLTAIETLEHFLIPVARSAAVTVQLLFVNLKKTIVCGKECMS